MGAVGVAGAVDAVGTGCSLQHCASLHAQHSTVTTVPGPVTAPRVLGVLVPRGCTGYTGLQQKDDLCPKPHKGAG